MYQKTAKIEKSHYERCIDNNHFGKQTNADGLCHYCECCFIAYEKLIGAINKLEKTRQIVVNRRMRTLFILNNN